MSVENTLKQKITARDLVISKVLTSAQVKALRATPITIVPVPRKGYKNVFVSAYLRLIYGGTNAFTETAANLAFKYTDGSGAQISQTVETTGFIDQTANTDTNAIASLDPIVASASADNKPIVLHNLGAGEIAGNAGADNQLVVTVVYRQVAMTANN